MREQVVGRIEKASRGTLESVQSLIHRVKARKLDLSEAQRRTKEAKAGPTVKQRQEELVAFYDRYEELVELLCDAAQYGPNITIERRYAEQRTRFAADYLALRPLLGAFLRHVAEEDGEPGNGDAFVALTRPETIGEFLHADDGAMISRITRTREALNLYAEHLRQLSAKAA